MADDPTVQFSLRRIRECPTCGHNTQPNEIECSLCGTALPGEAHSAPPQNPPAPPVAAPPSEEVSDPTVEALLPPRPPRSEEEPVKVVLPPSARLAPAKEAIGPAARPVAPVSPSRPLSPGPALLEPPPRPRTVQPSVSATSVQPRSNALTKWGGLATAALALFVVSFFAAKMFSSSPEKLGPASPTAQGPTTEVPPNTGVAEPKEPSPATLPPTPPLPVQPPQLVGLVTTAEQLLPIRIFGADLKDELRGVEAFRTQIEANVQGIREAYGAQLVENPQTLGVVVVELDVASDGQVASVAAHITGSIGSTLQQAILERTKALRFAPAQGEAVKVFYPLLFSPEKVDPTTIVSHIKDVWPGRYKVLAGTPVLVRAEANDTAPEVGTIRPGLFLSVVSSQGGWLGALSPKGKVGYVRRDAVFPRVENTTGAEAKG